MERGENENRRAKETERGLGEKEGGEPVDFVLMSPMPDSGTTSSLGRFSLALEVGQEEALASAGRSVILIG